MTCSNRTPDSVKHAERGHFRIILSFAQLWFKFFFKVGFEKSIRPNLILNGTMKLCLSLLCCSGASGALLWLYWAASSGPTIAGSRCECLAALMWSTVLLQEMEYKLGPNMHLQRESVCHNPGRAFTLNELGGLVCMIQGHQFMRTWMWLLHHLPQRKESICDHLFSAQRQRRRKCMLLALHAQTLV